MSQLGRMCLVRFVSCPVATLDMSVIVEYISAFPRYNLQLLAKVTIVQCE